MKEEPATLTSAGLETATQTVDRINSARNEGQVAAGRIAADRAKRDQQSLQVSANSLVNPPRATNLTPPVLETPPQTGTANAVSNDLGEIITAQTKEASDLRARRSEFTELGNLGTLGDFRTQQLADLGVPDNVRQLKDIQLQLADVDTASDLTKTRIQGAAGQTLAGGQREVTQEDRENAVRRSGLAAQASVLQGNIQTATTLVNQAVQTAYQDRSLKNSNLLNQINDLSGTVDNQTQQLLDQEKARVEADQAAVKEVKDSVALAMQSGAATPQEVAQLTDINATDADRLSLAQSISARGATEDRNLDVQAQESKLATDRAQRANIFDQINSRQVAAREKANTTTEAGQEAIDKKTADTEQALGLKALATQLLTESGLSSAVGLGFKKSVVGSIPFVSGDAIAGSARADFEATAERVANLLTLDNLDLMSGVLSETDIKILETAGSNLRNFDQSEEQYIEEINRIISVMDRTITNNGVSEEQASFFGLADDSDLLEINSIFE